MKQQEAFFQEESCQIQKEETNGILEVENDQPFKPHFGNTFMFKFSDGQPQITIGPHWPLSLCVMVSIIVGTYFISTTIYLKSGIWASLASILSGLILKQVFQEFFQKPWSQFYINRKSCQPCKLKKNQEPIIVMNVTFVLEVMIIIVLGWENASAKAIQQNFNCFCFHFYYFCLQYIFSPNVKIIFMLNLSNLWFAWSKQNKLKDRYEIDGRKSLGPSKYGLVIKYKEKKDGQIRTVRVVPKTKVINHSRFKQEINQMRYLNHENITRLIELFEDDKNLYFVLEYCDGGSLFEKILLRYYLKQSEARYLFQQIINSLNIAHRSAICQRDLRPESFHFINRDINNLDIKLIDLGFQLIYVDDYLKKSNNQIIETSRQGKLYFTAPEIFNGKLTEKSEIWASGVILHVLLTGELPFDGKDENEIYKNIQDNKIQIKTKGIIQKHLWMNQQFSEEEETLDLNFSKLKLLTQNNFLQKIMRGYVADQVKQGFADNLRIIFDQLDTTGSGFIKIDLIQKSLENIKNMKKFLSYLNIFRLKMEPLIIQVQPNQIHIRFYELDIRKRVFVDEERIYKTFKMFDLNNKGKISNENLWEILSKLENYKYITKEYCSLLISEVDRDYDGEIEYLEFIDMFLKEFDFKRNTYSLIL